MAHFEIHLDLDELPPDGTVFGVGRVVQPVGEGRRFYDATSNQYGHYAPNGAIVWETPVRTMDARPGVDFCPTCGRDYQGRKVEDIPNPPCWNCSDFDPVVIEGQPHDASEFFGPQAADAAKEFDWGTLNFNRAMTRARELGSQHGIAAAQNWMVTVFRDIPENDRSAFLTRIWQGLDDRDETVLDDLPRVDLSGEWADTFTGRDLEIACYEALDDPKRPTDIDPFLGELGDAYEESGGSAIEQGIRSIIVQTLGDGGARVVDPANEAMIEADVEALFDLIPGARDALQGLSIENTHALWDTAIQSLLASGDGFNRAMVRKRVAVALQVLVYGEFCDEESSGVPPEDGDRSA